MSRTAIQTTEIRVDNGPLVPGELAIDVEQIDVTMSIKTEPDMAWEHIDRHGHFHAYAEDGTLPTLEARTRVVEPALEDPDDDFDIDDYDEDYDQTYYVCAICDEEIEPKVIVTRPVGREFVPGLMSWTVEVGVPLRLGDRVSVVVTSGGSTCFGVGMVDEISSGGSGPGAVIVGESPLGRRKA